MISIARDQVVNDCRFHEAIEIVQMNAAANDCNDRVRTMEGQKPYLTLGGVREELVRQEASQ
jgi:hypothetical protein